MTRALGGNSSKLLQGFISETIEQKYNALDIPGFDWAEDMQLEFTYTQLQKDYGITPMANYYDLDSPAKPKKENQEVLSSGTVPRMKDVRYFNEDKIRKMIIKEQRFGANDERVIGSARKSLFGVIDALVGSHVNAMSYQRHQMVSAGELTLTADNNPFGINGVTFGSHVPSRNKKNLTGNNRWWTSYNSSTGVYSSEGSSCNPIKDLQDMVTAAKEKVASVHFEVSYAYMSQVLEHSKVKAALASKLFPLADPSVSAANVSVLGRDQKVTALGEIVGCPIKEISHISAVQKVNTTTNDLDEVTFPSFNGNVFVLVPDGKIGEFICVEPIALNGGEYASMFGGRLLITIGTDYVKKCQSYNSELTTLGLPSKVNYMWYLTPYNA